MLLACLIGTDVALAEEDVPSTFENPAKSALMTQAAEASLNSCVEQAAQAAGDEQERRVMVGVYIGPEGKPVSLAVIESSGREHLDKLVLRCVRRGNYRPAKRGKPSIYWIFKSSLRPKRITAVFT
ncbi:MAG: TonB family protein [Gammaproteobacteria bacterium]